MARVTEASSSSITSEQYSQVLITVAINLCSAVVMAFTDPDRSRLTAITCFCFFVFLFSRIFVFEDTQAFGDQGLGFKAYICIHTHTHTHTHTQTHRISEFKVRV